MYKNLIINIDELWLKGKNRKFYFKTLREHVQAVLRACETEQKVSLRNDQQRLVAEAENVFSSECIAAIVKIPGISTVQPAISIDREKELILPAIVEKLKKELTDRITTFKVKCKRVDKSFPHGSMDLQRELGHFLLKEFSQLKVDVRNPEILIDIKVMSENIFISTEKFKATGGLPVGTSGHVVTLISGGFDSPVASYMMSKRGCKQDFIFFYAYPYVGEEVKEKIIDICSVLGQYQKNCKLWVIPFGEIQNAISNDCYEEYRTILFRKYMIDTANLLANRVKADALVTGDALGQVSSQTMRNMSVLDNFSKRLILRPLVGFNKIEIIRKAQEVGTHDISIIPHDDACSLFSPKHPVIKADYKYMENFATEHNYTDLLKKAIKDAEVYRINVLGECEELLK
ncbi:tRNA 4-thiouridine(8) synthase ThiI [Halobacteriovorax marinus]|uniref:Probable tRNA sulfurtransferase n=1 Tax=Halobacteriovorax marinus (strain ATCC BAA-682 / DSM 15412 / SJ) TaxID=862908 RepID=E1X4X9_HALMS|nr:tRNA uracil 4-sulfurtransferase ThiI [Halobacteriovorax marinus]ATH08509.1 tRNA 4-thiouridine(8) synthase ThiI [Halobacteriovorax marinus]CBW27205.1 thiamine biosynthesis protein thiI [Halobacteriovorax marinus SJ]